MKTSSPVLPVVALVALAAFFSACAVSSENDPAYIKLARKMALLEESQQKSQRSLEQFYEELELIVSDINTLKASVRAPSGAASPEMAQVLETAMSRLQSLEEGLQDLSKDMVTQKQSHEKQIAKISEADDIKPAAPPEPKPRSNTTHRASRSAPSTRSAPSHADLALPSSPLQPKAPASRTESAAALRPSASLPPTDAARRPAAASTRQPQGRYYEVQIGDTLHSVARAHGVEIGDLCKANRMPMSATLFAGQSLYVPAAPVRQAQLN